MKTELKIEGMMCSHCTSRVANSLVQLAGVTHVDVSLAEKKAVVEHEEGVDLALLKQTVEDLGFDIVG